MLVGFVGQMGSGKGSCGDILEKHGFQKESFAKTVKDAIAPIFGWNRDLLEGDTPQSRAFREQPDAFWSQVMGKDFTPRQALQMMGTEAGRNVFHTDLWVFSLIKRLEADKNYVITDVRFNNEMKMIREAGGIIIQVQRGEKPDWYLKAEQINQRTHFDGSVQNINEFLIPPNHDVHYSEWAWVGSKYINCVLYNDGTLEDLESQILKTLTLKN